MDNWTDEQKNFMISGGNKKLNLIYEQHSLVSSSKPNPTSPVEHKHAFILSKYKNLSFFINGDAKLEKWEVSSKKAQVGVKGQVHCGVAIIKIIKGENLMAADLNGKSDPFVEVIQNNVVKGKTKIQFETLNPVWNETLTVNVDDIQAEIVLKVVDFDKISSNDPLGSASFSLVDFKANEERILNLTLEHAKKGTIQVSVTFFPLDA
eukprot:c16548_g1_i2.p1 GENE.c16548_g1_i2~~c16548_g1_i2.p1  ORF type:complete len:207 (+),score=88.28 c16548_g1_i2:90-710(+)